MFTAQQAQFVFDYTLRAYSQQLAKSPKEIVIEVKKVALAAVIVAAKDANLDEQTVNQIKNNVAKAINRANMEAIFFNVGLKGDAFRLAFDQQFIINLKEQLTILFDVDTIQPINNTSFLLGKGYYLSGQYQNAIVLLSAAFSEDKSCYGNACYYLAKSYTYTKHYQQAQNLFSQLLAVEKDSKLRTDYYDNIGMCYFQQADYKKAEDNYHNALYLDLANTSAQHNLALLYLVLATNLKDKCETFEAYMEKGHNLLTNVLDVTPHHAQALHTKARWYELDENYEQAANCYEQAKSYCAPTDADTLAAITVNLPECYAQLGHQRYQQKHYDSAKQAYECALAGDSQHDIAQSQLGMCLVKMGNLAQARQQFNALITFPLSPKPTQEEREQHQQIRADAWLNRAACLRKQGRFSLAKGSLTMANELAPTDSALLTEKQELAAAIIQHNWQFFKAEKQSLLATDISARTDFEHIKP